MGSEIYLWPCTSNLEWRPRKKCAAKPLCMFPFLDKGLTDLMIHNTKVLKDIQRQRLTQ